ncbi:MAG: hypothetical protein U0K93_00205, partial [Acutalibacteraceae bacterium]|nr:hypothetical protein [Acutalibacteraceae bacterium]
KYDPKKPSSVKLVSNKIEEATHAEVLHITDDNVVEHADKGRVDGDTASFKSADFSIYAVVEETEGGNFARLTIEFYSDKELTEFAKKLAGE